MSLRNDTENRVREMLNGGVPTPLGVGIWYGVLLFLRVVNNQPIVDLRTDDGTLDKQKYQRGLIVGAEGLAVVLASEPDDAEFAQTGAVLCNELARQIQQVLPYPLNKDRWKERMSDMFYAALTIVHQSGRQQDGDPELFYELVHETLSQGFRSWGMSTGDVELIEIETHKIDLVKIVKLANKAYIMSLTEAILAKEENPLMSTREFGPVDQEIRSTLAIVQHKEISKLLMASTVFAAMLWVNRNLERGRASDPAVAPS